MLVQRRAEQGERFGGRTEEQRQLRARCEVPDLHVAKRHARSLLLGDRLPEKPLGSGGTLQPLHRQVNDRRGLAALRCRTTRIVGLERLQELRVQRALAPALPEVRRQVCLRLKALGLDPRRSGRPECQQSAPGALGAVHVVEDEIHLHRPDLRDLLQVDPTRAAGQLLDVPEHPVRLRVAAQLLEAKTRDERGGRVDLSGDIVLAGESVHGQPPLARSDVLPRQATAGGRRRDAVAGSRGRPACARRGTGAPRSRPPPASRGSRCSRRASAARSARAPCMRPAAGVPARPCHGAARTSPRSPHRPKTRTIAGKNRPRIAPREVTRIGTLCLPRNWRHDSHAGGRRGLPGPRPGQHRANPPGTDPCSGAALSPRPRRSPGRPGADGPGPPPGTAPR